MCFELPKKDGPITSRSRQSDEQIQLPTQIIGKRCVYNSRYVQGDPIQELHNIPHDFLAFDIREGLHMHYNWPSDLHFEQYGLEVVGCLSGSLALRKHNLLWATNHGGVCIILKRDNQYFDLDLQFEMDQLRFLGNDAVAAFLEAGVNIVPGIIEEAEEYVSESEISGPEWEDVEDDEDDDEKVGGEGYD